ncbi:NUDIX domain-containing protein [Halovulum sp. GXIMD14793]
MTSDIFVYGSLCDADALSIVLGGRLPGVMPARLPGYVAKQEAGASYPVLLEEPDGVSEGMLLTGLTQDDQARLWYFEGAFGYHLTDVTVTTEVGAQPAQVFLPNAIPSGALHPWRLEDWRTQDKPLFLEMAAEFMQYYDPSGAATSALLYVGVHRRAISRLRARQAEVPATLRQRFPDDAVTLAQPEALHTGFFATQRLTYDHQRYDGGRQDGVVREVFVSGDAVAVLPWDPKTDTVLVIEQLRAGALARTDPAAWLLEPIAGLCDKVESAEDTARREALEEAGLELGAMVQVAEFYTSPGAMAEYLYAFVAQADLSQAGGVHGLADEHEDIRTVVVPLEQALAAVDSGEIRTGPLVLLLLALARRRDALLSEPGFLG